ncbi:hypothetical protein BWI75_12820 [Gloeocapsopsis sp. AAB1 = 1H9]|uniref:PH domain-containing protein n=1 Tax=Gloeocapsopsis dulcis AAB1 = 1H9 TaxID=1433147 RepID=A0A6N8FWQ0_9CHRO|nr:hypothetical protein [Gloeocapsopsis dulcis AAB1 = 1H9]
MLFTQISAKEKKIWYSLDEIVITKAQELAAILGSLNGDFANIVAYPPANDGGIFSIQLRDHPEIIPCF